MKILNADKLYDIVNETFPHDVISKVNVLDLIEEMAREEKLNELYSNIYSDIKYLLKQAEEHSRNSAAGYDEGWYNGECNAYEIILEKLEIFNKLS